MHMTQIVYAESVRERLRSLFLFRIGLFGVARAQQVAKSVNAGEWLP